MEDNSMKPVLRKKLADIRDEAMTLSAILELSSEDHTENPVWQFAQRTIRDAEQIMANTLGELDIEAPPLNEADHCEDIAQALNRIHPELKAESANTGGGIYCVFCYINDQLTTCWGMAAENWGCDVDDAKTMEHLGSKYVELSSECRDVEKIAVTISAATTEILAGNWDKEGA